MFTCCSVIGILMLVKFYSYMTHNNLIYEWNGRPMILWTDDLCSSQLHMQEFTGKFVTIITIKKRTQIWRNGKIYQRSWSRSCEWCHGGQAASPSTSQSDIQILLHSRSVVFRGYSGWGLWEMYESQNQILFNGSTKEFHFFRWHWINLFICIHTTV